MASISITVKDDLFTITMDNNEWTGLTVGGQAIVKNGNQGWSYTGLGPLNFQATATHIETLNPNDILVVKGSENKDYVAALTYTAQGAAPFVMDGALFSGTNVQDAQTGQIDFNQGMMMGGFSHES